MKIDAAGQASFYRGGLVVGELPTAGKAGTIVFFQVKDGRREPLDTWTIDPTANLS
jgi:hypothetical protein